MVEITAPVMRFSRIVPDVARVISRAEVMFIARESPKNIPFIMLVVS